MNQFNTHVCLVSGQTAPNLLPLLDDAVKPEKVELIVTPQMKRKADYLANIIKPRGIKVILHDLDSGADYAAIQELLMDIVADNEPKDHTPNAIALNVTGGTKWMAIAAQEVFRSNDLPVFYVDIDDGSMRFFDVKQFSHKLSQSIGLKDYLLGYGYDILSGDKAQGLKQKHLCQTLVFKVNEWEKALGNLNLLASIASSQNTLSLSLKKHIKQQDARLPALIAELENANILKPASGDKDQIHFTNEAARTFANGGWLEDYVNSLLNSLKSEGLIQDSPRLNLEIQSSQGSKNELDVAFMAKNHLHIIECKTKNMRYEQKGSETIYKLDSLSELGGLSTKAMLVSYRKLRPADLQRAKDMRINVVASQDIQNLKEKLKHWIA